MTRLNLLAGAHKGLGVREGRRSLGVTQWRGAEWGSAIGSSRLQEGHPLALVRSSRAQGPATGDTGPGDVTPAQATGSTTPRRGAGRVLGRGRDRGAGELPKRRLAAVSTSCEPHAPGTWAAGLPGEQTAASVASVADPGAAVRPNQARPSTPDRRDKRRSLTLAPGGGWKCVPPSGGSRGQWGPWRSLRLPEGQVEAGQVASRPSETEGLLLGTVAEGHQAPGPALPAGGSAGPFDPRQPPVD